MFEIFTNNINLEHAHLELIRCFLNYKKFEDIEENIKFFISRKNDEVHAKLISDNNFYEQIVSIKENEIGNIKILIYDLFKSFFNKDLSWGTLTGIRPVSLYENLYKTDRDKVDSIFLNDYHVSKDKLNLVKEVYKNQCDILELKKSHYVVYVHIPFCHSRCKYCSFTTNILKGKSGVPDDYIDYLIHEINICYDIIDGKKPACIYIGGGTPSTLSVKQAEKLIQCLNNHFPLVREFTFEAGRADSISYDLLKALKNNGVTRISINPQTMNDSTLEKIARYHTVDDVKKCVDMANKIDLDVNMDLIVGLPDENRFDVINSIEKVIELEPQNITIHSLAVKNGSEYYLKKSFSDFLNIDMTNEIYNLLKDKDYLQYYLYRQKRQVGEAENIGYSKHGKVNIFNILTMDDGTEVLGFGMGSVSKFINENGKTIRSFAPRDLLIYKTRFNNYIKNKKIDYMKSNL